MPAVGIANEDITSNSAGTAIIAGRIIGIDTDGFTAGDNIYVNTNGDYTQTKPTGTSLIQNIGVVAKVDASDGEIIVMGAGRSNDVPNIQSGYAWVGNGDGVATAISTGSLNVMSASYATTASIADDLKTGLTISASSINVTGDIAVAGTASFAYLESISGSAKIIGDAFIILNNNTTTQRFAGTKVQDSGSTNDTASFLWDGDSHDWKYEYEHDAEHEAAVAIFGPEMSDLTGSAVGYPVSESVLVGLGSHHITGSAMFIKSDIVDIGLSTKITGSLSISSSLGVGTEPSGVVGAILATNDVVAFASSDERLKENKTIITNPLEKIDQLSGYEFDWIPMEGIHVHSGHDIGVIAQEVEKVFPEIVSNRENGYKAVKYEKLVSVLIEGIKELKQEVETLKKKING